VDLRVNVVNRGASVRLSTEALADGGGAMRLVTGGGLTFDLPARSSAVVTIEGETLKVVATPANGPERTFTTSGLTVRWSGARALAGPASVLEVTSRGAGAASTSGKARSYRWGAVQFTPVGRADSAGVTRTRIEGVIVLNLHREYLRGLAEVPSSWPAAALQAQAIAARNYALTEYRSGTDDVCGGCHLWDDTRSQVYRGWGTESVAARWVQAVSATQTSRTTGLAVLYQGSPIRAYYSSSSGGRTRSAESAWGRPAPYLVSVTDPWSVEKSVNPNYARWQRTIPRARVAAVFGLPDVAEVKVTERDRSGAALTVSATSAEGRSARLPGATVRSRLRLPAPWLTSFEVQSSL
jgi:SpoIID/LytB domain protein